MHPPTLLVLLPFSATFSLGSIILGWVEYSQFGGKDVSTVCKAGILRAGYHLAGNAELILVDLLVEGVRSVQTRPDTAALSRLHGHIHTYKSHTVLLPSTYAQICWFQCVLTNMCMRLWD